MTVRVLSFCAWTPDGASVVNFGPGELLTASDPRVAGGFFPIALARGWVEEVKDAEAPAPKEAVQERKPRASAPRKKRSAPRTKALG